ncbi:MAG: sigma-54 dependent transcriptional regulator [bacterium]
MGGHSEAYLEVEKSKSAVLLVEDDPTLARILELFLREEGYPVTLARSSPEAVDALRISSPELVLMDLALPPSNQVGEGMELMEQCFRRVPQAKVIIVTGEGTLETALSCIRKGAEDYLIKPINPSSLSVILERALKRQKLERLTETLQKERSATGRLGKILGSSFLMQRVFAQVLHAAQRDANVLVLGESGTGKGLVAETIHDLSPRRSQPFVKVNCTALSEGVLESELFGHEKGSFTGAIRSKIGKFEYAHGGTLFLDEIGELPSWIQAKLLHAVEDKEIQRIGGNRPVRVDTRIIAATNINMSEQVKERRFRPDLYYRLNTIKVLLPPLRKRDRDIQFLAEHFLREHKEYRYKGFSLAGYEKLMQYDWPGNVRELRSVVYRAVGKAPTGGWIEPVHLEMETDPEEIAQEEIPGSLEEKLEQYERLVILGALSRHKGNVSKTAEELKLTRSGLHKKIIRLRIRKDQYFP